MNCGMLYQLQPFQSFKVLSTGFFLVTRFSDRNRIRPSPEKVEVSCDCQAPTNESEAARVLGMVFLGFSFVGHWVSGGLGDLTEPIEG